MTLDASSVVVTGTGSIFRAPVGTPFPADISVAVPETAWQDLGYCDPSGAAFSFDRQVKEIMAWQSYDPIRIIATRVAKSVKATMLETNYWTWLTAMGGGAWTANGGGKWTYDPPVESFVDTMALIVEGVDGAHRYRVGYRKAMVNDKIDFSFVREDSVMLPLSWGVLAADAGAKPFMFQTDDPRLGDITQAAS